MIEVTHKLKNYITEKKKSRSEIISTRYELSKYLGISRQLLYNRFENHKWSDTDTMALQQLFEFKCSGVVLTVKVKEYLKANVKKKRESYWTRVDAAKYLEISTSLLYQRMRKHNWKEQELIKISNL